MDNYITLEHLDQTVWSLIQRNSQLRDEISAVDEKVNNINITESDPVFSASPAAQITDSDISNWNGKPTYSYLSEYYMRKDNYITAGQKSGTSIGLAATAEGAGTTASGYYSHAEGYQTTASNSGAHAEGNGTTASNYYSHAEGSNTTASGSYSHAEGEGTIATTRAQHAFGAYNTEDQGNPSKGWYVEIVGNGTSNAARSNARTLDWSGNEWLAGKLTVGAGPTNNMDVATKQYVDAAIPTIPTVPTKTSELTNDSGFITSDSDEKLKTIQQPNYLPTNVTLTYYPITDTSPTAGTASTKYIPPGISYVVNNTQNNLILGRYPSTGTTGDVGAKGTITLLNGPDSNRYATNIIPNSAIPSVIDVTLPSSSGTLALTSQLPTKTSQLTNNSGYITSAPVTSVNGKTGAVNLDDIYVQINEANSNYSSSIRNDVSTIFITSDCLTDTNIRLNKIRVSGDNSNGIRLQSSYKATSTSHRLYSPYIALNTHVGSLNHNTIEIGYVIDEEADFPGQIPMITLDCTARQTSIHDLITPVSDTDAANKLYVDTTVANAISNVTGGFNASVVTTLPTTNIDTHTIYFVNKTGSTNDVYDEYMYINDAWEKIGNTAVDLSGYLRTTDIAAWAKASTKPSYTASEVGALPNTTTIPTKLSDLTNDAGYITSYTETDPVFAASAAASITSTDISNWNAKVSDDKTWNGVTLNNTSASGGTFYVPVRAQYNDTQAYNLQATATPSSQKIAMYSASSYLSSTTPTATDNSTKVATTAYVTTAISNAATTVTQTLTSGTAIATINGTTIYAPSYTDADGVSY